VRRELAAAEATTWLRDARIRAYNPTLALVLLLVPPLAVIPIAFLDAERFWPFAFAAALTTFFALLGLGRRATRGVRLNNDGVAMMTRGEEVGAAQSFREAIIGLYGRDVVGMSLQNLGVLALRALDVPSAIVLERAAIAAGRGFRFRWQPSLPTELARIQLAFMLAATNEQKESLDEAAALLEAAKATTMPMAIAFAARAHAVLALRRGELEAAIGILDEERALLRNVLPLNDGVLCEAMISFALLRSNDTYRGASRSHSAVLADEQARLYVRRLLPEAEAVLVS
jgi:hypothetical protein